MQRIIKNIIQLNAQLQNELSRELGISKILAQILINRGIGSVREAEVFLKPNLTNLLPSWQLRDMEVAVQRIAKAKRQREKILIFGDYDVDGVTSVALLETHLRRMGIETVHYIPHRIKEGYGLNDNVINVAKDNDIKLIVTVDCGINSLSIIDSLRRMNIDVIVTDHHEPQEGLPPANAIINPKRHDCSYPFKDLSGVGVVYKFIQALTDDVMWEDLDLVTLGTIADSVALNGENRIIVREGLKRLSYSCRLGIQALMELSGINKNKTLGASVVSYILGPRLNASGRMDTAEIALRLLLSRSVSEAQDLAKALNSHNRNRQKIEEAVFREAKSIIDKEVNFKEHRVIVISGRDWHPGVLGIVASRLTEKFYRPTVLISENEYTYCRGSARSIKDFSIFDALVYCQKYLENFGGHKYAAGLIISKDNIDDFRRDINHFAQQVILTESLLPYVEVDMEISLSDISKDLICELRNLEPFGPANPEPVFYIRNLTLRSEPQVLSRDTLKFWVTDSRFTYPVIGFGLASLKQRLIEADSLDLAFYPELDNWQDRQDIILEAKEIILK